MAPYLVTEFSQAKPQILILGDAPGVMAALAAMLERHGFGSEVYDFRQLAKATTRERVRQRTYYKIICLQGLAGRPASLAELKTWLGSRREPILFLTRFDSTVDIDNLQTRSWYQACRDQYRQIVALAEQFPKANLLIVRDLLLEGEPYHPAFAYIFRDIGVRILIDPGINFFFISQANFLQQIEGLLFVPYTGEKTLFAAEAVSATRVFQKLNDVTADHNKIVVESYPPVDFEFPFALTSLSGPADLNLFTSEYFARYTNPPQPGSRPARPDKIYQSTPAVRQLLQPKKTKAVKPAPLETITLPPPRPQKKPAPRDPRLDMITLPPELAGKKTKAEKVDKKYTKQQKNTANSSKNKSNNSPKTTPRPAQETTAVLASPSRRVTKSRRIMSAVRATITSGQRPALDHYLAAETTESRRPVCQRVELDGFNFYQCALRPESPSVSVAPAATTKSTPAAGSKSTAASITTKIYPQVPAAPTTHLPPRTLKQARAPKKVDKKYTKQQKNTANSTKNKSNNFAKIIDNLPKSWRDWNRRLVNDRLIVVTASVLALIFVLAFFFIYQPRLNQRAVVATLTDYFTHCRDVETCFDPGSLRHTSTFTLVKRNQFPDLLSSLNRLLTRRQRVQEHLGTYFATAWQDQPGNTAAELKIVRQSLEPTLTELETTQRLLAETRSELLTLASDDQLSAFESSLATLESDLKLVDKYLGFLETTASLDQLGVTAVIMDNNVARTGGGLILGVVNLQFRDGHLESLTPLTSSQLIAGASITVNTPHQLEDITTTETSGWRNLTFDREFNEVASLLTSELSGVLDFSPRLVIGMNLDTLGDLERLLLGTPLADIIKNRAPTQSVTTTEADVQATFSSLHTALGRLGSDQGNAFVLTLLDNFDNQDLQFYATGDVLQDAITAAGLRSDAGSVLCPGGFGSGVCYLDTFAQHDNYLASNARLEQTVSHRVELTPTTTRHLRTITFTNQSASQTARDYLTFAAPQGSTLESFQIDGQPAELDEDGAYTLVLPAGRSTTLTLTYTQERQIANSDFTYSFYDQHQNGFPDQHLQVSIDQQVPYSVRVIAPSAVTTNGVINFVSPGAKSFFGAVVY